MTVLDDSPALGTFSMRDEEGNSADLRLTNLDLQLEVYPHDSSKPVYVDVDNLDSYKMARWLLKTMTSQERAALYAEVPV